MRFNVNYVESFGATSMETMLGILVGREQFAPPY
jgi:hypothetical protein